VNILSNKTKNLPALALVVLALWQCPRASAQAPLSNLVFAVGTTWQDLSNNQWSYVLLDSPNGVILAGRRFAVFGKDGNAGSANPFTQRGVMVRQTDATTIDNLLNQSVALGDDLLSLSNALNLMFHRVPGITNQTLAQKVVSAFQVATIDPESNELLSLMGKGHPGLDRCLGRAFSEPITSVTTYEVRELDPTNGAPGDVAGRVTVVPGAPVVLPAPGKPFQAVSNNPSDHLRVRLRWGTPLDLRRLSPLQFGYSVWRTARTNAEAQNFQNTPPTLAQLHGPGFFRANAAPVMPAAEMDLGSALGGAENPADRLTYIFADTGRATATVFGDGEEFYYFITARDILGRDGLSSPGGLARACRRLPPGPPTNLRVENDVLPGSTNLPRLLLSWDQNLNLTNVVTHYWVYRWVNPTSALTNDAVPTNGLIAVVPQAAGTNRNYFLDDTTDALKNPNLTNIWYTLRAVNQAACDPLLSQHTAPAWGVLRQRDGPDATTGELVGSCGTPVVMFQNFATNLINADTQTWNFRFSCVRRDRGIAWVQFAITNTVSGVSTQMVTLGPVYFPPDGDTAQLNYPLPAGDISTHTLQVGCVVGTIYDQVSAAAKCTLVAPVPPTQQLEAVFYAGQLLTTALSFNDPLLTALNAGGSFCTTAYYVTPDPSGMVSMQFSVASGAPLLIRAMTNNTWYDVALVTPDSNNVYWVSYPACLVGPLPTFQGCTVNLPLNDAGCDQHVARAADDGAVAPIRVRFRLTRRTREYRVYRRAGDGPLTLFAQGAALYDPANPNKLIETKDGAMPPSPTRLCYFVQLLDNQGHGSPLAFIGCKEVKPATLPRPVLSEPQPIGAVNNPQVMLTWFCPTSGIARFQFKIARADAPAPSPPPSGFSSPDATPYLVLNTKASYLGLLQDKAILEFFSEAHMTRLIGASFGPGPQFTISGNVQPDVVYEISVAAVDDQGHIGPNSEVWRFKWVPPTVLATVPWPARPLPPVNDFDTIGASDTPPIVSPRVAAVVFYDTDGVAPNPRYPIGVRIGELGVASPTGPPSQPNNNALTDHTDEYLQYNAGSINSGNNGPTDPNTGVFRALGGSRPGQLLLPIVVYREQLTNALFPRVSGGIVQVTPLIERVPWKINLNRQVTIPDRLFAGFSEPHGLNYYYYFYVRDLQPVQLGAKYRYFVVRFNDQREIQEIFPAGDVELPLN
jgi:hypothetical protein